MRIAKLDGEVIAKIGGYRELFPKTSFPKNGPSEQFLDEQGCVVVRSYIQHDEAEQKLVDVDPYIENGEVYTVKVEPMTNEEKQARARINVPDSIDMRRARLALLQAGLLDTVETAIVGMSGTEGKAARIEWEYATVIRRNHPLVGLLQESLSLTDEQMDELFIAANNLE